MLRQVKSQGVEVGRRSCRSHQRQHRHLAPARVWQADHGTFGHAGPAFDQVLDLGGIDVLAARNQHVLAPSDHAVDALPVLGAQVAGMQPAVAPVRVIGLAVVGTQQVRRLQPDFADRAGHHVLAGLVDQSHPHAQCGSPDPPGQGQGFVRRQRDRHRATLGAAVDLRHRQPPLVKRLDQRQRHDHRAAVDEAQAVQWRNRPIRMLQQRPHRRRDQQADGGPPLAHCRQPGAGLEARQQPYRRADGQRRQRLDAQPADMEQRQGRQHPVSRCQALHGDRRIDVGQHAAMGVDRALGAAGGARGVDQQQVVGSVFGSVFGLWRWRR